MAQVRVYLIAILVANHDCTYCTTLQYTRRPSYHYLGWLMYQLLVFIVPQTHDMVSQLLSPTQPKNLSDLIILAALGVLIVLYMQRYSSSGEPAIMPV